MLDNIPRLAIQSLAYGIKRRKADRSCLVALQNGQIGYSDSNVFRKLGQRHLAFGKHDVKIDNDSHQIVNSCSFCMETP